MVRALAVLLLGLAGDKTPVTIAAKPLFECEAKVVRLASDPKGSVVCAALAPGNVCCWSLAKSAFAWKTEPQGFTDHSPADSEKHPAFVRALDVGEKTAFFCVGTPVPHSVDLASDGKVNTNYISNPSGMAEEIVGVTCDARDRWTWTGWANGQLVRCIPNGGSGSYNMRALKGARLRCLAYDGETTVLAAGCDDGKIRFVDASSANVDDDKVLPGEGKLVAMAFANKGTTLLAASESGDVVAWNVATKKPRFTLRASDAAIRAIIVHPKQKWFATGDALGAVKVWAIDKGAPIGTLNADGASKVHGLAFADGGKALAGALGGKTVVAWDVSKL